MNIPTGLTITEFGIQSSNQVGH